MEGEQAIPSELAITMVINRLQVLRWSFNPHLKRFLPTKVLMTAILYFLDLRIYLILGTSSKKYSPKCEFDGDESVLSVQNHLQKTPAILEANFSAMQLNCNWNMESE